jgi:hypothetical protein
MTPELDYRLVVDEKLVEKIGEICNGKPILQKNTIEGGPSIECSHWMWDGSKYVHTGLGKDSLCGIHKTSNGCLRGSQGELDKLRKIPVTSS